jgi:hypothetical protein
VFIFKQSTANYIPVGIADSVTGLGITGLAFNASGLSCKLAKSGLAATTKTLTAPDWVEIGNGWYYVKLSTSECDTLGVGSLIVIYTAGGNTAENLYPFGVVANLESDTFVRLGAPAGGSVSADIAAVKTDTAAVKAKTDNLPATPASEATLTAHTATLAKLLGISGENSVRDTLIYNGDGDLESARIRIYDSAANANAQGATGLLATWNMTATYTSPGKLSTYKVVLV